MDLTYSQSSHPGSSVSHYTIDKNVCLINFVDYDPIMCDSENNKEYTDSIINATYKYLSTCIFIDFGAKNKDMINQFKGYVDLSESGDCLEALHNLYDVLHQINNIDCNNVIIFNFYKNKEGYYSVIYDRLYRCCSGREMLIPIFR